MKSGNGTIWARQVAEAFLKNTDPEFVEFLDMWKNTPEYVFPFEKLCKPYKWGFGTVSAKKMTEIENAAINLRNRYYSQLVREQLLKLQV